MSRGCRILELNAFITLCYCEPMRRLLATLILAVGFAMPGAAQVQRLLPANGKLGVVIGQQHPYPTVQIDSSLLRLAPGGVILDQQNRYILHGYLPPQAPVLYVLDGQGSVTRIVILRPDELARSEETLLYGRACPCCGRARPAPFCALAIVRLII